MDKSDLERIVRAVGENLIGLTCIEADQRIDEMRRFVYAVRFSGDDPVAIRAHLKPSEAVLKGVSIMAAMAITDLEKVVFELRYHVWTSTYAAIPDSAFGRQFQAHMAAAIAAEKAPRKAKPRKAQYLGYRTPFRGTKKGRDRGTKSPFRKPLATLQDMRQGGP